MLQNICLIHDLPSLLMRILKRSVASVEWKVSKSKQKYRVGYLGKVSEHLTSLHNYYVLYYLEATNNRFLSHPIGSFMHYPDMDVRS